MSRDSENNRNLDFSRLLPTVDVRPEFVVICDFNYCAAFLLRLFERQHLSLFDAMKNDSQKHESFKSDRIKVEVKQKWTAQKMIHELGAVYRSASITPALKLLHKKGFIRREYAMNGGAYVGHDVFFDVVKVQTEINKKFPLVLESVNTGMGTDKERRYPKKGRPIGSKTKKVGT